MKQKITIDSYEYRCEKCNRKTDMDLCRRHRKYPTNWYVRNQYPKVENNNVIVEIYRYTGVAEQIDNDYTKENDTVGQIQEGRLLKMPINYPK